MSYWSKIYRAIRAIFRRCLYLWVHTKVLNQEEVEKLSVVEEGCKPNICYVLRTRSFLDSLVLEQSCLDLKLHPPLAPLDVTGTYERKSLAFLIAHRLNPFRRLRHDQHSPRIKRLFQSVSMHPELDIQLVPVTVFWGRSPDKENSLWKIAFSDTWAVPSSLRKVFMMIIHGKNTLIHFETPISLRNVADQSQARADDESKTNERLGHEVDAMAIINANINSQFKNQREALIGPDLSHRRTLVNGLLNTAPVKQAIQDYAQETGKNIRKAERKALKYADEIAADYSHTVIRLYHRVLTWVWNKLYDGVNVYHIEPLKSIAKDHEIIYVPSHRSHIDYLLLSYVLYVNDLVPPHIAAGINLNVPILGPILRRGGAFFMRRSFKGNPLYRTIFDEYLHTVITGGFSIEYFIEGGRSRTGRLLPPRAGMLSMTLKSFIRNSERPIAFVPVFFGYERVFEGLSYLGELKGKKKQKESLFSLLQTLKRIRRHFGKVHVNFSAPVYLQTFLDNKEANWKKLDPAKVEDYERIKTLSVQLAKHINTQINQSACLHPIAIIGTWLLATPKQAIDKQSLVEQFELAKKLLNTMAYSEDMVISSISGEEAIDYTQSMGIIQQQPHTLGNVLYCSTQQAALLVYFRNNCLHLFALPALVALLISNNPGITQTQLMAYLGRIYPFLKAELFLRFTVEELEPLVVKILDFMQSQHLVVIATNDKGKQSYQSPDPSSRYYKHLKQLSGLIQPTLERYYLVLAVLNRYGSGQLTQNGLEELVRLMTERMSLLHDFNLAEHYDKRLFQSFLDTLFELEIITEAEQQNKILYGQGLSDLMNQAQFLVSKNLRYSILQIADGNVGVSVEAQS